MEDPKATEFKISAFFEMTPDLICIAGKDGFFKKINRAVIDKLGFSEQELFERPIASFIYPEDRELTSQTRQEMLSGKDLLNFENRYITKTGEIVWLAWTSIYFPDDEVVFAIAKDITNRKQVIRDVEEKYIKFKSLATHFKTILEQDRKFLALELHEELAQLASVVKMDVDWIRLKEPGLSESAQKKIEHASVISELLINTIRRISFSISPAMLEELGLDGALKWHCHEFSILKGIPCLFESNYEDTDLTPEIKTDFFRICQEALSNVMYHAGAAKVKVSIRDTGDQIALTIADDGKGFANNQQAQTDGLMSIRERVASINGELSIQTEPGSGTSICVTIAKPN